ncbi:MAG TPA: hypothetical protein VKK79_07385, partial [Candidatus Lokiarchaeia archaeon]|nr:hypothetical protein [Candidatus Lokiarchaeia archaeon]
MAAPRGGEGLPVKGRVYIIIAGLLFAGVGAAFFEYYSVLLASRLSTDVLWDVQNGLDYSLSIVVLGAALVVLSVPLGPYLDRRYSLDHVSLVTRGDDASGKVVGIAGYTGIGIAYFYMAVAFNNPFWILVGVSWLLLGTCCGISLQFDVRRMRAWRRVWRQVKPRLGAELAAAREQFASDPAIAVGPLRPLLGSIKVLISSHEFTLGLRDDYPRSPPVVFYHRLAPRARTPLPRPQGVSSKFPDGRGMQIVMGRVTTRNWR